MIRLLLILETLANGKRALNELRIKYKRFEMHLSGEIWLSTWQLKMGLRQVRLA